MSVQYVDKSGLTYVISKIKSLLNGKVDVIEGKGLSTNDYTSTEKTKLAGVDNGANKYVHPSYTAHASGLYKITTDALGSVSDVSTVAKSDITALGIPAQDTVTTVDSALSPTSTNPVQNKVINTELGKKAAVASPTFTGTPAAPTPVAGTNSTQLATTAFVGTAITNALSGITSFNFQIVATLPPTGVKGTIYLVSNSGAGTNEYDEYLWVTDRFELIGSLSVDLSGYVKTTDLVAVTTAEIDAMFAA